MSVKTTNITSSGVIYHVSSGSGDSASKWIEGAARKGVYDGKMNVSALMFPADQIAEALKGVTLLGAEVILRRDSGYGVGAAQISVAPLLMNAAPSGYQSRGQIIEQAMRKLHWSVTTEGTTVKIPIPGATLMELKGGSVNAFLLYAEEDGTDSYARMSTEAVLRLNTTVKAEGGTETMDWQTPEYTRTLAAGDLISSEIYSHVSDLREFQYYLNIRRRLDGLDEIPDVGTTYDLGAYADWATIIQTLQAAMDDVIRAENREPHQWIAVTDGQMPSAAAVDELRAILRGDDETRVECEEGLTAEQTVNKSGKGMSETPMPWTKGATVKAGRVKSQETAYVGGVERTVTVWKLNCGAWIFSRDETLALTSGSVELTVTETENDEVAHIALRGIKISEAPTGQLTYSDVFDATVVGEADCAPGETVKIPINTEGLALFNDRRIHGVGISYTNQRVVCKRSAALLINNEAEQDQEPEGGETE